MGESKPGVPPSSRIRAEALGIPSSPRIKGRLENTSEIRTCSSGQAHNQMSAGMKGSKDTMWRNRNNKQMWKFPGTTHIAIVRCGLGMLKEIKHRLQMNKHRDTLPGVTGSEKEPNRRYRN